MNEQTAIAAREPEPMQILSVIDRAARDPNVDVEKMERLLALAEKIHEREAKAAYDQAMNDAQTEMRPISRDCHNPQTRSRYASYEQIDTAIRPIYTKHGFAMSFGSKSSPISNRVIVTCRVSHRQGHTEHVELEMPADGKGAKGGDVMSLTHATGSALSYGKRYICNLVWNLSFGEADDDGNAAGGPRTSRNADPNPEPSPAPKARQNPKIATEKTRTWFIEQITPVVGCYAWALTKGILQQGQELTDWPLEKVPCSKREVAALIAEIQEWAKKPSVDEFGIPLAISEAIIHVPPAGMKRSDYKTPDTIGGLYKRTKEGDANARTRLWGFVKEFALSDNPSEEDITLRNNLDSFEKWYDEKKLREDMDKAQGFEPEYK